MPDRSRSESLPPGPESPHPPPPASRTEAVGRSFARLGEFSHRHAASVLALTVAVAWLALALAGRARFDNSFEAYFAHDDPLYRAYLDYRDEFGADEVAYLVYEAPNDPHGIWSPETMRRIADLTRALEEEVPFVREVTSLTNVEFVEGVPGGIAVHPLLEKGIPDASELGRVRERVLRKPLYLRALVSDDGRFGGILVRMEKSSVDPLEEIRFDPEGGDGLDNLYPQVSYRKIVEILRRPEYAALRFYQTGDVALNATFNLLNQKDSATLGLIAAGVIALILLVSFRHPLGVIGPLVVVGLGVLVSVATAGALGWRLDAMFGMLPTLLIAVGVADSVHILSEYQALRARGAQRSAAVRETLARLALPCLLTSLTTAAGFGSLASAPIRALAHFGVYAAAGVMAAFLLSVTTLVALLRFAGPWGGRAAARRPRSRPRRLERALRALAGFDRRHRRAILAGTAALGAVALAGATRLEVNSNFLEDFSDPTPVRRDTLFIDRWMGGTNSFEYVIDTGRGDGIQEPSVLQAIDRLEAEAARHSDVVGKAVSVTDFLKDINRALHDGEPRFYKLPETRALAAQLLLLYEMSGGDEIDNYLSSDRSQAVVELRARWTDSSRLRRLVESIGRSLREHPIEGASVRLTGTGSLWLALTDYITRSQIRGFLLAFVAITAMLCLLFRSLRLGLLAMAPNLLPPLLTLGVMGWAGIPLDYVRLLIAPVAIGLAVDYSIHLISRYRYEFATGLGYEPSLEEVLAHVGRALVIASVALVLGFLVLSASVLESRATFGLLLAVTIAIALAADFLLLPALILTLRPFGEAPAARGGERIAAAGGRARG